MCMEAGGCVAEERSFEGLSVTSGRMLLLHQSVERRVEGAPRFRASLGMSNVTSSCLSPECQAPGVGSALGSAAPLGTWSVPLWG